MKNGENVKGTPPLGPLDEFEVTSRRRFRVSWKNKTKHISLKM